MPENNKKRLVIIGAAESGVGAALLGKKQGWTVFVTDFGKIKNAFLETLKENNIEYEQGQHSLDRILEADCIVKSPGVNEKTDVMKSVRKSGIEVCSEIEFGYRYKGDSKIIGITGSNGKSTTTKLIYDNLVLAEYDAALVGNIGYSFARKIAEKPAEWYVMEISSFQLDDIHEFKPDIAILLNITPDHLDRYSYLFANYIESKFKISKNQTSDDFFIVNKDDKTIEQYLDSHLIKAQTVNFTMNENLNSRNGGFVLKDILHLRFGKEELEMPVSELSLYGKHNQYNCMAAGISALIAQIRSEKIRENFRGFKGLPHRLEYVATVRGITFINDSKATNVNSVWYALECMKKPVILILGGQDKGNDYSEIMSLVKEKVKSIICLGKDNTPIHEAFGNIVKNIIDTSSAKDAVNAAYTFADSGDVVLLSPACASFDLFSNYEERGFQFKQAVLNL